MDEIENQAAEFEHTDAVEPRHRFPAVHFYGEKWDLRHLDAFALRIDPDLGFEVDVVVLFTCHCFTHSITRDARALLEIPPDEIYEDDLERRVLSKERYELSRRFLPGLVKNLPKRAIRYAGDNSLNYFTAEVTGTDRPGVYAVFSRFCVTNGGSADYCSTCSQLTALSASLTGLRRGARFDLLPCSEKHIAHNDEGGRSIKDNGHRKGWPSHARLSIAFPQFPTPGGTRRTGRHCLLHSLMADLAAKYRGGINKVKPLRTPLHLWSHI